MSNINRLTNTIRRANYLYRKGAKKAGLPVPQNLKCWCSECDERKVDNYRPSTGTWFIVYGMQQMLDQTETGNGDFHAVLFPICKSCLNATKY
jgi:hypothetical protein